MLDLVFTRTARNSRWSRSFVERIISIALKILDIKNNHVEIGVRLIGPEKMRQMNNRYRGINKATDVLSFPLDSQIFSKYGIISLGDIFICGKIAVENAEVEKIPVEHEIARLIIHGLLHLLGYDHEKSPREAKNMLLLQEQILKKIF